MKEEEAAAEAEAEALKLEEAACKESEDAAAIAETAAEVLLEKLRVQGKYVVPNRKLNRN